MRECVLLHLLLSVVLAISVETREYQVAKPGCQDECGGVKIPFPFGIGFDCYFINDQVDIHSKEQFRYRIKCDNSTNPPALFIGHFMYRGGLTRGNQRNPDSSMYGDFYRRVLSINLSNHTLCVSSRVAYECYIGGESVPSTTLYNNYKLDDLFPFEISVTRNRLVGIRCGTIARVDDGYNMAGCMTSCNPSVTVANGVCSGIGCCETSIFDGMNRTTIYVSSMNNTSASSGDTECNYAFIGEIGSANFSETKLFSSEQDCENLQVPVVYDWSISPKESCSAANEADVNPTLCGLNTYCVDVPGGYRCQCMDGYMGNQYLPQGCQDINECEDERLNDCQIQELCVNKVGGYECRCPRGHHGNGTITSPCTADTGATKLILGLAISMSSTVGFIILYGLFKLFKARKEIQERQLNFKRNGGLLLQQEMSSNDGVIQRAKIFSRSELERATDNFNDNRVLGRGGQGTVYKGMLVDGTIVAVKKSKKVDENQLAQFINEVVILSQINHRNVVKLFGCCLETEVPLLVYEFVSNGTLYQHIHHPSEDFHMTWRVRFQIAVECATTISYLHSFCSSPIYHRDIKSSNILLDEKYKAKVSDFETSRSVSIDKTHVTTCVQGTLGYLDPEFFRSSQFSEKSDVYSFGVVLLELLTSMKPIFTTTSGEPRGLATEFIQIMETYPDQLNNILDTQVVQNCPKEEIETLAKLVEACLSMNGKHRPTMSEVAMTLEMIKKQHDGEGNPASEQGIGRQEGHNVWTDQMNMTNGGPCSTSSFSTFTGVEPLLFDSN